MESTDHRQEETTPARPELSSRLGGFLAFALCALSVVALLWGWLWSAGSGDLDLSFRTTKSNLPSVRSQYTGSNQSQDLPRIAGSTSEPDAEVAPVAVIVFGVRELGRRHLYAYWPATSLFEPLFQGDWDDVDPSFSPDGKKMIFASNRGGQWDLYILETDRAAARQLTATAGFEGHPVWSPDAHWVAFEADYAGNLDIWMLPVDSEGDPIQLTSDPAADMSPSWHPGGGSIAFVSIREGQRDLFSAQLDPAAGGIRPLTRTPEAEEGTPRFSPDGRWLAYSDLSLDGVAQLSLAGWPMESAPARALGQGTDPAWSPDGSSIAAFLGGRAGSYLLTFSVDSETPPALAGFPAGPYHGLAWAETNWLVPTDGARGTMEELEAEPPFPRPLSASTERGTVSELSMVEAPNPYLLTGVSLAFDALRARTAELAGWDFLGSLENAFVGLNEPLPPGTAYEDWLRTGRAFAFHLGALKAEWVEMVREDYAGQTFWRVFVRVRPQDGMRGEPLRAFAWDFDARYTGDPFAYDRGGALDSEIHSGFYLDFTALAADYGFERLPALPNWRTYYYGARFNQFVFREGLSWEQAMLELYPAAAIATPTPFRTPTPTPTLTLTPTWTPIPTWTRAPTITPWVWPTSTAVPQSTSVEMGEAP